jgi:hypothetical protein
LLRRARGGTLAPNLCARPLILRPVDPKYPQVVINSEGTWVQVARPPGRTSREPNTVPVAIPGNPILSSDPFDFPDAVWRDPSLVNKNTALISNLRTEVYPLVDPPVEPEHRAPGARTTASAPRASRRATYTTRRRSAPYPSQDPGSVVPRAPSEHSAPEEEDQQSPEEVEEVEVEVEPEDAQSSEEAPLAPPEGEDCETEGAAVTAPRPILPATPKTPSVLRGSIETVSWSLRQHQLIGQDLGLGPSHRPHPAALINS